MLIARYFILFILFSVIGWVWECTFCTVRDHHWQNRGFLYGPLCPIYGTGVVIALVVFTLLPAAGVGSTYSLWQIFLICAVCSAVLEFVTSWVLEKCFHAVWWDYSGIPTNIQGRICLPATCGFGLAGVVIVKWVLPAVDRLPVNEIPLVNEALSILLAVFLGMDLALTVESLSRLTQRMEEAEERFNERMEESVQTIIQGPEAVGDAVRDSVKDAGETAAIAAMLAADAAKDKVGGAKARVDGAREDAEERREDVRQRRDTERLMRDEQRKVRRSKARDRLEQHHPGKPYWIPEEEWQERLKDVTGNLSRLDRYHIRSIAAYRPRRKDRPDTAEKLRRFFRDVQKKAGKPEDRQVKKSE